MSCTEAEAKTKWCPFYRVATSGGGDLDATETDNRSKLSCCIASACMAWQWSTSPYECMEVDLEEKSEYENWSQVHDREWCPNCGVKRANVSLHYYRKVDVRDGFCGLTAREGRFVK